MKPFSWLAFFFVLCLFSLNASAQTTVKGTVTEKSGSPLIGVTVVVKGTGSGTSTDFDGNFILVTNEPLPFTLTISYVGYLNKDVKVTQSPTVLSVFLEMEDQIFSEVVISASRVEEKILESPVTIEKLDLQSIKNSSSLDFYDELSKLKGVTTASGSMTFNAINTRGFGGISNTRFVQLVDGVDNSAPLLNFPLGNIVGLSELDARNIELVPGAASALYGPNAFNGIMIMTSKSPFDYEGLSIAGKVGYSDAKNKKGGLHPLYSGAIRYAKAFKDKVGFKTNFSYFGATDWLAGDYFTDIVTGEGPGRSNFNAVNRYGDETQIFVPFDAFALTPTFNVLVENLVPRLAALFGGDEAATEDFIRTNVPKMRAIDIRRTGFTEEDLLDNRNATSMKGDAALHWKPWKDGEISYTFRIGTGNSVYQGSERYALRKFLSYSNKLDIKGKDFLIRSYMTQTDAGDSYNMTALGAFTNEGFKGTAAAWAPLYLGNYSAVLLALAKLTGDDIATLDPAILDLAHSVARKAADDGIPRPGTPEFQEMVESVRNGLFQKGGAGFIDNSRLFHTEATYDFTRLFKDKVGLLVGANHRMYSLFTDGTVFNEDPDGTGVNTRIKINEYGAFAQLSYKLLQDRLKLTGSVRFDKNVNFKGIVSPRVSAVASLGDRRQHNIRASFQTGFRNPDSQAQYIYFPTTNILLGGTEANAGRYGIYEGGAYTKTSYDAFVASRVAGQPNPALLEVAYFDYIKPEKLSSVEIGYKAGSRGVYFDWNAYLNMYKDFITQVTVVNIEQTSHKGNPLPGVNQVLAGQASSPTTWRPYVNISEKVKSWGTSFGITYKFFRDWSLRTNYNYLDLKAEAGVDVDDLGFNSPNHMFNVGFSNPKMGGTPAGIDVSFRWQSDIAWASDFGDGTVESFGTLDAQLNYTVDKWGTVFKVGGTNLTGPEYRTNVGGPYIGRIIYGAMVFDMATLPKQREKKAASF
jgi:iron complex outermembrane recepter protein